MARRSIEGTVVFDGLIEGRIPPDAAHEVEPRLREWVTFAQRAGVRFSLEVDGNTFSLLVDPNPVPSDKLGEDPAATVREALDQLLQAFAPPHRMGVFSTLRSSEFRPGKEIQTIYAVSPPGRIELQEREVDADTEAPPEPLTNRERVKLGLTGLLAAAVVVLISSYFVDYGALLGQIRDSVTPIDTDAIVIEADAYKSLFTVTAAKTDTVDRRRCLILTLERVEGYPNTPEQLNARWKKAQTIYEALALEALADGAIRIEQYNKDGKLVASAELAMEGFTEGRTLELALPLPRGERPTRVRFRY